ncbi:MAG: NADH-quinone oxidoreductase subunit C [Myxococcales bacterium]|nr:NADH-quinone oxidoreductase subunit C [Myxococcales bacterium]USN50507.1 MAG: NADH-quinone oxidoreductase subunit C [Myxococcales bacterium]
MFKSLKQLLDQRLGSLIVQDDLALDEGYYIKVDATHLNAASYFLKHDPDTRLTLLDYIMVIKVDTLPWTLGVIEPNSTHEIVYQLKSLKLPYKINIVIEVSKNTGVIPSIQNLFIGARWLENDIRENYYFDINED